MADDVREEDEWLYGESESIGALKREVAEEDEEDEQSRSSQPLGSDGIAFDGGQEERGSGVAEKEGDSDNVGQGETETGGGGDGEVSFSFNFRENLVANELSLLIKMSFFGCLAGRG